VKSSRAPPHLSLLRVIWQLLESWGFLARVVTRHLYALLATVQHPHAMRSGKIGSYGKEQEKSQPNLQFEAHPAIQNLAQRLVADWQFTIAIGFYFPLTCGPLRR